MGIVIRQSFYSSISAYIGVGIGYINAIILMPLFMSPEEIGLMRAVMSIALLLTTFSSFGTGPAIIRFFPLKGSTPQVLNQLFTFGLIVTFIAFSILALSLFGFSDLFFEFFKKNSPAVSKYLGLIVLLILQMTLFKLFESVLICYKQIILPNIVRDLVYKFLHILIIIIYGFSFINFDQYMIGHAVIYLLLILALAIPVITKYELRLDFRLIPNIKELKTLMNYASISIVAGLGMVIIIQVDQIMVTKHLGLASNGIYTIALFMAAVVELPRKFVSQISAPIIARCIADGNNKEIGEHYKKASINQLIVGILIFLLVAVNLDNIYTLMPNGNQYQSGWWIFIIIGMVKLVDMGFSLNGEIIGYSKYFRFNLYVILILCCIAVISNTILIPMFGLYGAAMATLMSYVLFNVAKFLFIKAYFGFSPFSASTVRILLIGAFTATIFFLIPTIPQPVLDIVIRSGLLIVLFLALTYSLKVSMIFNDQVELIFKKVKPF